MVTAVFPAVTYCRTSASEHSSHSPAPDMGPTASQPALKFLLVFVFVFVFIDTGTVPFYFEVLEQDVYTIKIKDLVSITRP